MNVLFLTIMSRKKLKGTYAEQKEFEFEKKVPPLFSYHLRTLTLYQPDL